MASKKGKSARKANWVKGVKNEMPPPPQSKSSSARTESRMPPARPSQITASVPTAVHRPTAEISVSEQHSLELAKTVMTATISTIVSLRKIFPRHRFAIRTFDCADPEVTYDAFMNGIKSKFTFEPTDDLLNWKILTRSDKDPAVNKLLDWIEIAATDALEKKYLAKLQLSFHSIDGSEISDANLLEAYHICFDYANGQLRVGAADGKNAAANSAVLRDVKTDLYTLVDDVVLMIQRRAPLPGDRRMNMMLLYNDTCPPDYEPPGFHPNRDPNRLINTEEGVEMGSMNTGFHVIKLSLLQPDPLDSQGQQRSSKRRRIDRRPSMSSEIDGGGTQEHGLQLLQGMGRYRALETQNTQLVSGTPTILFQQSTASFLPYSQTVMERIEQVRGDKGAHQVEYDLDEPHSSSGRVACECGAFVDEDDMIQCNICEDFKHIRCYGHLVSVPPAAKFACYSCLLDIEGDLLSQMKVTCVRRRALYYLHDEKGTLYSVESLAQYLERDEDTTKQILGQLEHHGYVKRAAGYEKSRKGKGTIAEPLIILIADDKLLLSSIFRPDLDIPHKLLLPNSTSPETATSFEPGRVQEAVPSASAKFAGESSTEGTPSPHSAIVHQSSRCQDHSQIPNSEPWSLGASRLSKTSKTDLTPEPEVDQAVSQQHGTSGTTLNQAQQNRTKLSAVNSPWIFRSTPM